MADLRMQTRRPGRAQTSEQQETCRARPRLYELGAALRSPNSGIEQPEFGASRYRRAVTKVSRATRELPRKSGRPRGISPIEPHAVDLDLRRGPLAPSSRLRSGELPRSRP